MNAQARRYLALPAGAVCALAGALAALLGGIMLAESFAPENPGDRTQSRLLGLVLVVAGVALAFAGTSLVRRGLRQDEDSSDVIG